MANFTKHALVRMKERGFLPEEILMVLRGEVPTIVYPSPRESTVDLYFGRVGEKFVMLPFDRVDETIITVRPMRRKEREVYVREISNEEA